MGRLESRIPSENLSLSYSRPGRIFPNLGPLKVDRQQSTKGGTDGGNRLQTSASSLAYVNNILHTRPFPPAGNISDDVMILGNSSRRILAVKISKQFLMSKNSKRNSSPPVSEDRRFHYKIYEGPSEEFKNQNPSMNYVENHNADFDYDLAALDFEIATSVLIEQQSKDPALGNFTAPICYLVRQTIELRLKALNQFIAWKTDGSVDGLVFTHDLSRLWQDGKRWLIENDYRIEMDARLETVERLVDNIHAIDPSGDLFRFGTSRHHAFGRAKTYDRVGYDQKRFFEEYELAKECISFWSHYIMRQIMLETDDLTNDEFFNPDDFPKLA